MNFKPYQFKNEAMTPNHPKYEQAVHREHALYVRPLEIRTPFGRDYTRILHSAAYRRLKYKTQVFYSPENDHVSTRIDHVHYVASIGRLIADYLGLNSELTEAIAIGHDLGHTPFGHDGERVIGDIVTAEGLAPKDGKAFWHAKNGLHYVDELECLTGPDGRRHHLDLTYAVRDGIICHSGAVNGAVRPRDDVIDLNAIRYPGEVAPYSWEGCIIKIADNIAYLGRDIDDAQILGIIDAEQIAAYSDIVRTYTRSIGETVTDINNANVIHLMVTDLCVHSSVAGGLCFSDEAMTAMDAVLKYNRQWIYFNSRLKAYKDYGERILHTVYDALKHFCENPKERLSFKRQFPILTSGFERWFSTYCTVTGSRTSSETLYKHAIIDYISGMTDRYIEKLYREQITFSDDVYGMI